MAKITNEQLTKWNAKLSNGFTLDLQRFVVWGEKEAVRNIDLGDSRMLQASIGWREIHEGYRFTGLVRPEMHLSVWTPTSSGMMSSSGLGATVQVTDKTFSRKNWNEIAKITGEWNDERILEEAKKYAEQLKNPFVV